MLFNQQRTPFDLRFRLGPFPVTVNPLFWLGMALLGQSAFQAGFEIGLLWIACGFISILWHELGHAVTMRHYGSPARIELFAFGGLAIPAYQQPSAVRRLLIAAAGPLAGFLLLGLVWGSDQLIAWADQNPYLGVLYTFLFLINLIWSLFNLLPIWPLDGSHILREGLVLGRERQPDLRTQQVSLGVAGFLGVVGLIVNFGPPDLRRQIFTEWPSWFRWVIPGVMMTIFLFLFAYQSYEMMKQLRRPRIYDEDRLPWERR
ncbi:site-2 protease family protein [Limnoglobus roseus]|uniref:SREBP protease/CBS domain protein n=1 Tax=Limnoglobus roseus TaxID=2598579 RepID=A0A5C1A5Z8_9BACT|nr:site-2 protease family protein [Limnoglobus roseus]QEL13763.1 SREBP protease/CBS domain protein [Limnoglobus roseus]